LNFLRLMDRGITIDDKFVAKLKKGDEESFHQLYNHVAPDMKLVCRRYVRTEVDAEDVFQEGFLKVYKSVRKLKSSCSFKGWMKRIFVNTALDHLRKAKNRMADCIDEVNESRMIGLENNEAYSFDDGHSASLSEDECMIIREVDFTQEELLEALSLISEHYRLVFQLFVIDNFKHQEIAEMLSINEKTSKTRLLRARGILKKELCNLAKQKLRNEQDR
jgi:RNA polymerase sigma-70 factor (ECF subfamily)